MLLGDVHLSDRPPSSCTDSYADDLFELLDEVRVGCSMKGAAACIIAGDLFHSKVPHRTSHRMVQGLIRLLKAFECPVYVVVGNHDIQNDRLDSVSVTQPLGVVFESGAARELSGWDENLGCGVYGVPWQQEWSQAALEEALAGYVGERGPYPGLVVSHAPIYPPGQEPTYEGAECTPASWWAEAMGHRGSLFYGHIHEPHGVYEVDGVSFCNNGALSRGSLDEYNLNRPVVATVWDIGTGEFEPVELHAKPAEQVFRLREKAKVVSSGQRLDGFLAALGTTTLATMSVEAVIADITSRPIDREVRDAAVELVEESYAEAGK